METKEYLNQIVRYEKQIQNKLSEISRLRALASGISIKNDGDRVQTSSSKDKISGIVAKIVDLENELDFIIDKRSLIVSQIEKMGDTDSYDALAKVYILGKDLKVVAIESNFSYRHFLRVYNNAIQEFETLYGNEYLEKSL